MAFLGLADAIISISPSPGGPGRTKDRSDWGRFTLGRDALASERDTFMSTHGKISRRTWLKGMMKPRFGGAIALAALIASTVTDNRGVAAEIHDGVHPPPAVILQVLKAFDNPEGAIFSADGSHVFVSNPPRPAICPKASIGSSARDTSASWKSRPTVRWRWSRRG